MTNSYRWNNFIFKWSKINNKKTAMRCLRSFKKGNFVSLIMKRRPELRMNLMPALCMYFTFNFIQTSIFYPHKSQIAFKDSTLAF